MATKEVDGLLQVKDAVGDVNVIYPVTKAKNVEGLLDESGKLCLNKAKLIVYSHGDYLALGRKLGSFGYSVRKKKKAIKK